MQLSKARLRQEYRAHKKGKMSYIQFLEEKTLHFQKLLLEVLEENARLSDSE